MSMAPAAIPRATVAAAFDAPPDTDALPPGDLPMDRFAARFLAALTTGAEAEAWTVQVFDHLVSHDPALAVTALCATLDATGDARATATIADGPLADLVARAGPEAIGAMEAADHTGLAHALGGIETGALNPFLAARIEALQRTAPGATPR